MSRIFLIADTHFGDELLVKCERAWFKTAACMDENIVKNWNETVSEDDIVYVLGDFAKQGTDATTVSVLLNGLKGRKRLVMGNHDNLTPADYKQAGFEMVYDCPIILDGFWILSHEPMYVTEYMPYANIYGHVHSNPNYKDVSSRGACVSAERLGLAPVLLSFIKQSVRDCN